MFRRVHASSRETEVVTMWITRREADDEKLSYQPVIVNRDDWRTDPDEMTAKDKAAIRRARREAVAVEIAERRERQVMPWGGTQQAALPLVVESLRTIPTFPVEADHDPRVPVYCRYRCSRDGEDYFRLARVMKVGRTASIQFADDQTIRRGVDLAALRAVAAQIGGEQ